MTNSYIPALSIMSTASLLSSTLLLIHTIFSKLLLSRLPSNFYDKFIHFWWHTSSLLNIFCNCRYIYTFSRHSRAFHQADARNKRQKFVIHTPCITLGSSDWVLLLLDCQTTVILWLVYEALAYVSKWRSLVYSFHGEKTICPKAYH